MNVFPRFLTFLLMLLAFQSPLWAVDTDHDGFTDAEEVVLGTDPNNRFDPPYIAVNGDSGAGWVIATDQVNGTPRMKGWDRVSGAFLGELDATGILDYDLTDWDLLSLDSTGVNSLYLGAQLFPVANGVRVSAAHADNDLGGNYTCVLTSEPKVWCSHGQGDSVNEITLVNPTQVSVGEGFVCAIHNNGQLACWDYFGSSSVVAANPVVDSGTQALSLASGKDHVCAIVEQIASPFHRYIQCWGQDGVNGYEVPTSLASDTSVLSIYAHGRYTCVIEGSYTTDTFFSCFNGDQGNSTPGWWNDFPVTPISADISTEGDLCVMQKGFHLAEDGMRCSPWQIDTDGDGYPDYQDTDDDNDGVPDAQDHFPLLPITGYPDNDNDGWPDDCNQSCLDAGMSADPDDDNDTVLDVSDAFQYNAAASIDTDHDTLPDSWNWPLASTLYSCLANDNNCNGLIQDRDDDNDDVLDVTDVPSIGESLIWGAYAGKLDHSSYFHPTGFGADDSGKTITSFSTGIQKLAAIRQSDGKIVVTGYIAVNGADNQDVAIARYNGDGSVDTSFGSNGLVTLDIGGNHDQANAIVQQTDGKLVVAGSSITQGNEYTVLVARVTSTGVIDTGFGTNGVVQVNVAGAGGLGVTPGREAANAVIQQADGKLVVAGTTGQTAYGVGAKGSQMRFAGILLVRLTLTGALDTSFDTDGIVATALTSAPDPAQSGIVAETANALVQQSDGKLVISGFYNDGTQKDFAVVRYTPSGALDTTFNSTGYRTTSLSASKNDEAYALTLQTDGKLVAAGYSDQSATSTPDNAFAIVRYTSTGALDTTFNTTGKRVVQVSTGNSDEARAVVQQTDNKLVLVGKVINGSDSNFATIRLNTNGSSDTAFNSAVAANTNLGAGNDAAFAVEQPSSNKLLLTGSFSDDRNDYLAQLQYNLDGSLDTTFDGDGLLKAPLSTLPSNQVKASVLQSDGKIVTAGRVMNGNGNFDIRLARYTADGVLDTTFGSNGLATLNVAGYDDEANAIVQQVDGKLIVAGRTKTNSGNSQPFVARYSTSGLLDTTFGANGIVQINTAGWANAVVQQSDGKIVIAGTTASMGSTILLKGAYDRQPGILLVRLTSTGAMDTTFDADGIVQTALSTVGSAAYLSITPEIANSLIQQGDGKFVIAGFYNDGTQKDFAVVRYTTSGALDATFNSTGYHITSLSSSKNDEAYALALQTDGKLVAAGYSNQSTTSTPDNAFAVVRYTTAGALDTTFNTTGKRVVQVSTGNSDEARAIVQQTDGQLVLAGSVYNGANTDFALVRVTSTGVNDATFNFSPVSPSATSSLWMPMGTGNDAAVSLLKQQDGKLIAVGNYDNRSENGAAMFRIFGETDADGDSYRDVIDAAPLNPVVH